ncbi:hypothetical protein HY086_02265 [Candidatus Gottesmanbacteria bacterium]|nr:hypothetical protein [Candidatus Gottesmanbacteria bacterium]
MKIQDIAFFGLFVFLLLLRQPKMFVVSGLFCLLLAIPLFATWTFFTAERLTWYATTFFLTFVLISLLIPRKVQ